MPANPRSDSLLHTGTVTFLFTDIEGSTRLWDEAWRAGRAMALEQAIELALDAADD